MIVTRSRLHAVRYKLAVDRHLAELGNPFKTLVAFSGTVQDGGHSYTEANMNSISEAQTARTFESPEYRMLIAANKFQTGFRPATCCKPCTWTRSWAASTRCRPSPA